MQEKQDGSCVGGNLEPSLRIPIPSMIRAILNYWLMVDHNWTSCHYVRQLAYCQRFRTTTLSEFSPISDTSPGLRLATFTS